MTWDATAGGAINDGAGAWLGAGQWNNGSPSATWTSGDDAIFGVGGAGGAVTLASPTTVNSLTFNSFTGTYTLGTAGQTITLNNGITKNASGTGAATIISPVTLGAAQSWTNYSTGLLTVGTGAVFNGGYLLTVGGTGNTTVTSAIGGAGGLTKNGIGTILALSGVNTYSGPTTIKEGLLIANSSAALGDGSATNTLIFNGDQFSGLLASGPITSGSGRSVILNNRAVIITNYPVSIDANISGSGALNQNGSFSTLTLSGNNTYTGTTAVGGGAHAFHSGGVLVLNSANALPGGIGATGGTSDLVFFYGVIGLGAGDFYRPLKAGKDGVTFNGNSASVGGGWAAYGADRVVNIGGDSRTITWATSTTGFGGKTLMLGAYSATHTVDFQNPIDMGSAARTVRVNDGAADVDGKLSGNITGIAGGGLIKTGLGTLVLSGTNNYADTTTVSAGTLRVNGTNSGGGAVTVSAGGALGGIGAVSGAVTAAAGGSIKLFDGAVGTLTLGSSLTLSGTAANPNNLCFDLGNGAGGTDKIVVAGAHSAATANGALVNFNQLSGGAVDPNTYTLIQGGAASDFTGYALATTRAGGHVYSNLVASGNDLQVTVASASVTEPAAAFWHGGANPWTTLANWTTDATGGTGTAEIPGVRTNVTFATTTPIGNLTTNTVDADFEINSLTFNAAARGVTIGGTNILTIDATNANGNTAGNGITAGNTSGTNTIASKVGLGSSQTWTVNTGGALTVSGAVSDFGAGRSLTKAGAGTLTLSGVNTYSGPTTITDGTLEIGGAGQLGGGTYSGPITINTGATFKYNSSADQTLQTGVISGGGSLIKDGDGTLTLNAENAYTGPTTIANGELRLTGSRTFWTQARDYTIASGAVLNLEGNHSIPVGSTTISGAGTLRCSGPGYLFGRNYNHFLTLALGSGGLIDIRAGFELDNDYYNNDTGCDIIWTDNRADLNLDGLFDLGRSSKDVFVDALTGSGKVTRTYNGGVLALNVGVDNGSGEFTGIITNTSYQAINFTKTGTGTQTLSGANTYTGATTVNGGTLALTGVNTYIGATTVSAGKLTIGSAGTINSTSGVSIGAGEFNYNSATALSKSVVFTGTGGTLSGTGTISTAVTVTAGNTLAPGSGVGTINLGGGLTIADGGIFNWENNTVNTLGTADTDWDVVNVTGATTISSTVDTGSQLDLQFAAGTSFSNAFWDTNHSWDFITGGVTEGNLFDASNIDIFINGDQQGSNNVIPYHGAFTTAVSSSILQLVWTAVLNGDADKNGVVDAADYITVKQNFGMTSGATWAMGNFDPDSDGNVDWDDLQLLMANFATRSVGGAPPAPEPATLGLLAIGALAVLRRRRK